MDVGAALVSMVVPVAAMAVPVVIVWLALRAGAQKRADTLATIRFAIEKGQELDPAALAALTPKSDPLKDLRGGLILLGVSLGLGGMAVAIGQVEQDARAALLGVAAIPFFIGLALIGLHAYTRRMRDER